MGLTDALSSDLVQEHEALLIREQSSRDRRNAQINAEIGAVTGRTEVHLQVSFSSRNLLGVAQLCG